MCNVYVFNPPAGGGGNTLVIRESKRKVFHFIIALFSNRPEVFNFQLPQIKLTYGREIFDLI